MKKFVLAAVISACIFVLPMQAYAAQEEEQKIEFQQNENQIEVKVTSAAAAREEISSLQLSLQVVSVNDADIQFMPNKDLPAKIVDSRYHKDTGTLNIYVAGGESLFKDGGSASLGSVVIGSGNTEVTVSAVEGSLKYVKGTNLVAQEKDVVYPEAVNYPIRNDNPPPGGNDGDDTPGSGTENPGGSGTGDGSGNTGGSGTGNGSGNSGGSGTGSGSGNTGGFGTGSGSGSSGGVNSGNGFGTTSGRPQGNRNTASRGNGSGTDENEDSALSVNDETKLRDTLARAAEFRAEDYTEESFQLLQDAIAKAEALLEAPDVTQEQLDEAQLVIENAIGMLELKDMAPVIEPEEAQEEDTDGGAEPTEAQETGQNQGQEQEKSHVSIPVVIGIIVVVILIAAVIVAVLMKKRK